MSENAEWKDGKFGGFMFVLCALMTVPFFLGWIACMVIGARISAVLCVIGMIVCTVTCLWIV